MQMDANTTRTTNEWLIRLPEVIRRTGLSRSTIYRLFNDQASGFPKPVKVGARMIAWRPSAIDAWQRDLSTQTKEI